MHKRIYFCQINHSFGNNAFLPYSTAMLWSCARVQPDIVANWTAAAHLMLREPLDHVLDNMHDPALLAVSCYLWNWNYSMALIAAVKARWPQCCVVCGGPEVPDDSQGFLESHELIDYLVHGEGEMTFVELLRALQDHRDLSQILGISWRRDGITVRNADRPRLQQLAQLPSPYLDGTMDEIIAQHPLMDWHASQETHRGCPYSCTFCDWGSATYSKVRQFDTARLLAEIKWFARHEIDLLYNVDANYGMFARDLELTTALVAAKAQWGHPRKFRASYAKKSDDKVFAIAQLLNDANMSKGVTLSTQSMDGKVLQVIKRRNIATDVFGPLVQRYQAQQIPTYTEVILGLPEETYHSFAAGIEALLENGQHDSLNIYFCMLLRNSEMSQPAQRQRYGICSQRVPLVDNHASINGDGIAETMEIVTATAAMPHEDWRQAWLLSWLVQALHCLDLTQQIARDYRRHHGSHVEFYQLLIREHAGQYSLLGQQMDAALQELDLVLQQGGDWQGHDPAWGPIRWPREELTFLQLRARTQELYQELRPLLLRWMSADRADSLLRFQAITTLGPDQVGPVELDSSWDWLDPAVPRRMVRYTALHHSYYGGDRWAWARDMIWYGRKASAVRNRVEKIYDETIEQTPELVVGTMAPLAVSAAL